MLNVCGSFREEILLKGGVAWGLRREDFVKVRIVDIRETEMTYYEKKKDRIRIVPIGIKLSLLISKYLKTVPKNQKYLFGSSGSTAYRRLQDLCIRAEIPRRPFHALRATCVKFHQAEGWTIEQISELTPAGTLFCTKQSRNVRGIESERGDINGRNERNPPKQGSEQIPRVSGSDQASEDDPTIHIKEYNRGII
jgi:hypothetical protein